MNVKHLTLFSRAHAEQDKVVLFDGVFWVAQGIKASAAVWISSRWFHEGDLEAGFDLLSGEVGTPVGFKMVGSARLIQQIANFLSVRRYRVLNQAVREGTFELRFFPKDGKIHVARKIKVLIVDDSKTIRNLLAKIMSEDPQLDVVGTADRPSAALPLIQKLKPDVITLDLEMPEVDGIAFLKQYLPHHPVPTVMITSIGMEEGTRVLQALEAGAVDYVQKPSASELEEAGPIIVEKIKAASTAKLATGGKVGPVGLVGGQRMVPSNAGSAILDQRCLVAIGSSTGGTEALRKLLTELPAAIPPVVITQHIPAVFSKAFADRMNSICPFEVSEAVHGMEVLPGNVYIAPGGKQMQVRKRNDGRMFISIDDSPPVNRHKPSVDYLFDSVEQACGGNCIGIILTGMGADGAKGLLKLKAAGARTIAQDEASCVVFGMPREAIRLGAAREVLPLGEIASKLVQWLAQRKAA
ncbi:MAG: chemotaxis response regulator protein-glutamate methylesterase [Bdellovibrionales bacterium]|nr:chemotaxis response regulator protein-glutamate methylesterase [Bdellovibrionales bacterium]